MSEHTGGMRFWREDEGINVQYRVEYGLNEEQMTEKRSVKEKCETEIVVLYLKYNGVALGFSVSLIDRSAPAELSGN